MCKCFKAMSPVVDLIRLRLVVVVVVVVVVVAAAVVVVVQARAEIHSARLLRK